MTKTVLGVVYGSRTVEHDVSVVTALQLMDNANRDKYEIVPLYISRDGVWYTGAALRDIAFYRNFDSARVQAVRLNPTAGDTGVYPLKAGLFGAGKPLCRLDAVIPALHGMNGEDGTVQGLLELMNIPYTSPGMLGSALGMDKLAMKAAFIGAGLPALPYQSVQRAEFENDPDAVVARIEQALGYPLYAKPANLGSSIGISRADDAQGLHKALSIAFAYDRRVLVERGVAHLQEVNCAVLGFGEDVRASLCEQPVNWEEFLTFEDKYLRSGKSGGGKAGGSKASTGMQRMSRILPAPISDELTARVQALACQAFTLLDCRGVSRIDFIIDKDTDELYINEINTIPGSFAFYLWEPLGIPYSALIDELVAIARRAHREKNRNNYAFESRLLDSLSTAGAKGTKGDPA